VAFAEGTQTWGLLEASMFRRGTKGVDVAESDLKFVEEAFRRGGMERTDSGNVRRTPKPNCAFCGASTKLIGRKLFCRDCGYTEGCCDGGKEAVEGEC